MNKENKEKMEILEEIIKHDENMFWYIENFLNVVIVISAILCVLGLVGYFILR